MVVQIFENNLHLFLLGRKILLKILFSRISFTNISIFLPFLIAARRKNRLFNFQFFFEIFILIISIFHINLRIIIFSKEILPEEILSEIHREIDPITGQIMQRSM